MKAKHISKLRKQITNFKTYTVSASYGLFGNFEYGGKDKHTVLASNPKHAVERYLRWYYRHFKIQNSHHTNTVVECTNRFGEFKVVASNGYTHYFM